MTPPTITEDQVLDALRPIIDPDFRKNIVELGFVKNIAIDGGNVSFDIELTTPACPIKEQFERDAHACVAALDGVANVSVTMTAQARPAPGSVESEREEVLPGVQRVVAVASGKGGVGKSTAAINLALALAHAGARVGVMDCDVYGPSLPLLTATGGRPGTQGKKILPIEGHGLKLMSIGYFTDDDSPVIWRGPMVHGLIRQFLTDVLWGELDYLIVDMPPGTGDAALTLTQNAPLSGAVIVTTANDLSLIDARKGLEMFRKVDVPVLGIIENMSYFVPPDLPDRKYYIFGEGGGKRVADDLGIDFLGEVPIDPTVVKEGDLGRPIVMSHPDSPVAKAYDALAAHVTRTLSVLEADTEGDRAS
ncbi:MAG: Mrp/NBP35 family ATP-binding protein [bacterium]|nr:Mrp/NBP35 family ATP-binding protein [bacterium]MCP5042112.1 Mrp/NBP35 family ATP-binding protein [bacterium]